MADPKTPLLGHVSLDDKYLLESGRIYLTGIEALVRLLLMQRQRDLAAGLNTAGYVSGYQGSPISGLDFALWRAHAHLAKHHVSFNPGLNEDLAATAVWGTQQIGLDPLARYDGVYSMWYGKGPGVDRSGDVFVHGNAAGASPHGGVLLIAGDDHAARTTTTPHQSDVFFSAAMIPTINPTGVQEYLDLGLHGWALSRYSGFWVGFKAVCDNIESSANVDVDPNRVEIRIPDDFEVPPGGLNLRWPDSPLEQEQRMKEYRIQAALAYARANRLNYIAVNSSTPRLGIVSTGKAFLDVLEALELLNIDQDYAAAIGIRILKVGMTWPLEPEVVRHFATGLEEILVVEEKRPVIESQLKDQLYNWPGDRRPRVIGKHDGTGQWEATNREWLLTSLGELDPVTIAHVIAQRIERFHVSERINAGLARIETRERQRTKLQDVRIEYGTKAMMTTGRLPYYCSGCPHNTSTNVPEGSRALAGIGCHFMAMWMDRDTSTVCQMGGEGVSWVGQYQFTETPHVFANLGDGTYLHSGTLAIRAAVATGVNITYKILYNGSVAMTGGQPLPVELTVPQITQQLAAENVKRIVVVTEDPRRYGRNAGFPQGVKIRHRDQFDAVQRELRAVKGVSAVVYDQACAADTRRKRKRGLVADPARSVFINDLVCEGCGDCSVQSNCMSVLPLETEWGRKRVIDQSACNKDYSCLKGLCPSFVTVEGGRVRKGAGVALAPDDVSAIPPPSLPPTDTAYGILICGIGGTGVLTLGALIGMAAHLDGLRVQVLDMTGLAQKGGAVLSQIRIASTVEAIRSTRIPVTADLLLSCDLAVSSEDGAMDLAEADVTAAVVNMVRSPAAEFIKNPDLVFPQAEMEQKLRAAIGEGGLDLVEATNIATHLLGDSIFSNTFLLGYAFQRGYLPVTAAALEQAIDLNGVQCERNKQAFSWGRLAAHQPDKIPMDAHSQDNTFSQTLDEIVDRRVEYLTDYQNQQYADRYKRLVAKALDAERSQPQGQGRGQGQEGFAEAVARNYFKLLAYKDEYEVARLFTNGHFLSKVNERFEGDFKLKFHLAPPLFARPNPVTGRPKKRQYGPWVFHLFKLLARMKGLRGTPFDIFGYTRERRHEREAIRNYEARVEDLISRLDSANHDLALEIASLPADVRGFGTIKLASLERAREREEDLLELFEPRVTR